jgi:hypothetical protein
MDVWGSDQADPQSRGHVFIRFVNLALRAVKLREHLGLKVEPITEQVLESSALLVAHGPSTRP